MSQHKYKWDKFALLTEDSQVKRQRSESSICDTHKNHPEWSSEGRGEHTSTSASKAGAGLAMVIPQRLWSIPGNRDGEKGSHMTTVMNTIPKNSITWAPKTLVFVTNRKQNPQELNSQRHMSPSVLIQVPGHRARNRVWEWEWGTHAVTGKSLRAPQCGGCAPLCFLWFWGVESRKAGLPSTAA